MFSYVKERKELILSKHLRIDIHVAPGPLLRNYRSSIKLGCGLNTKKVVVDRNQLKSLILKFLKFV